MADTGKSKIALVWFIHPVFCALLVLLLSLLEEQKIYLSLIASNPKWVYPIQWIFFYVLGLPIVIIYERLWMVRRHRVEERQSHHEDIISALDSILLERYPWVEQHSKRTANLARTLCDKMKIDLQESKIIVFAAMFHDIGKLFLDSALLNKQEASGGDLGKHYQSHPVLAQTVLDKVRAYQGAGRLVRYHHERWDGKGYPEGVTAKDIPLGSRIIAVADAFDALTHGLSSTKETLSREQAIERIKAGGGTKYDPGVVVVLDKSFALGDV